MTLAAAEKIVFAPRPEDLIAEHESLLRQPGLPAAQAAAVWRQLGRLLIGQNLLDRAIEALIEAATLDPEHAETFFDLGNLLFRTGNTAAAVAAYRQAAGLAPTNAAVWHNFGNALAAAQSTDAAIACFDEAIRLLPTDATYRRSKAVHLLQCGRKGEARSAFAELTDVDRRHAIGHLNLALLKKFETEDAQVADMEAGFADPSQSAEDRAAFGFGLFKAYDDLKDYPRAFGRLVEANRLKRSTFDYDASLENRSFEDMRSFFTRDFFERHAGRGFDGVAPIFIIGMPRSGTTLTEQILSSHSDVAAGGEAFAMTDVVTAAFANEAEARLMLMEEAFTSERALTLGRNYASRMRNVAMSKPRFTDKMPLNFRWIGFIAAILPKARFVHCTRDPISTCFSVFGSYFASSGNRYAYDLDELGAFYLQYQALMRHWNEVLPGRIFDAPLEGFVQDQEAQTRTLLDYCGLDFQPECLDFHRNANPVTTLSAMQVRQPIYRGQDEKVKPYLPFLSGLVERLSSAE